MARPSLPSAVARQLRQEAGFGCCVCGVPILQYHHIVEWAKDQHYRPDDMMVLCPLHHDQATKGAMPLSEQRALKASPFNIRRGRAKGVLSVRQDYCAADFGTVTVVGEGAFLRIDGEDLIGFNIEDGQFQISLRLYNDNDELILHIERNEWVSGNPLPWDVEADWQLLILRQRAWQISISIDAKTIPLRINGELCRSGRRFLIEDGG